MPAVLLLLQDEGAGVVVLGCLIVLLSMQERVPQQLVVKGQGPHVHFGAIALPVLLHGDRA